MIRRFFLSLILVTMCATATPLSAMAFDPFGGACSAPGTGSATACKTDSTACQANGDPVACNGPKALLLNITDVVSYIAGALAIVMIIVGAIRFVTAGSDVSTGSRTDTDVEDARRTITSALIGLAVIILARTLITYAIRKL